MSYEIDAYISGGPCVESCKWKSFSDKIAYVDFKPMYGHRGDTISKWCVSIIEDIQARCNIPVSSDAKMTEDQISGESFINRYILPLLMTAVKYPDARFYGPECDNEDYKYVYYGIHEPIDIEEFISMW